ncbi:YggT family protein [Pseudidiomarina gelatinasegens]|jgi:YggT family protein|uniref:YggT family protein n=1 Tax=Pseudidiomarina gelatinasegens TaxID=2487740 RepID=A0A451GF69_9GAMM|nr:YggT family protein [Pseudidiomarina gelatinasegens]RWU11782.1 YggT family protein [Pseudidiomarina gelatinasegens]|tara:strand:- start:349 stop:900 length:552 start_codon:yes stop_codon:yes gene_type:complete
MDAFRFLVEIVFDLFLIVVLLRVWMQAARADFFNPMSQFVVKMTNPLVQPMRRLLPMVGNWDIATLLLAYLVGIGKILVLSSMSAGMTPMVTDTLMMGLAVVLFQFLSLLFWLTIIMAIMSWFNRGYHPMMAILGQLTEPFLAPIRRIIPPIGGLDLSVLVLIVAIQFARILLNNLLSLGMGL